MAATFDDKLRLVTGLGMWHTADCDGRYDSIHLSDGPHGLRKQDEGVSENNVSYRATCFPTASAVACSWDKNMAAEMAKGIAREAKEEQVSVVLGPGTNMKRSPVCGRNFEYYSEDPFLAGSLATSFVSAMQEEGVGTSLKHFAGNSQETHRMTQNSMIDERALREIYLSAFEKCVKEAQPATIMASYNRINGDFACENKHLLTEVLRDDWGFEGLVVSDWGACTDLAKSVEAGMDLEMPDSIGNHIDRLRDACESGLVSKEALDRASTKVLELVEKYKYPKEKQCQGVSDETLTENHRLAKKIEENSAVLLKNEGALPLDMNSGILIVGGMAKNVRYQGGGSSHINAQNIVDGVTAFEKTGLNVDFAQGYDDTTCVIDKKLEDQAVEKAREAEKNGCPVLFFGGLTDITEGEGYDRKSFSMPMNQTSLFERICQVNSNVIFISFGGSPYDMKVEKKASAVLMMYLGGEAVMEACADIVTGKVNPSGKLAETYPYSIEDTPAYGNYGSDSKDVQYRESIFVGYRYYDTFNIPVHFPFGYGLSYTNFEYSDLAVEKTNSKVKVRFSVKNTGSRDGAEVAQIYVKNPIGTFIRARKELKGFGKVFLEAGKTKQVEIILDERAFSVFDADSNSFVTVNGMYEIEVGASIADIKFSKEVQIDFGREYMLDQREELPGYFPNSSGRPTFSQEEFRKLYGQEFSDFSHPKVGDYTMANSLSELAKASLLGKMILSISVKIAYLVEMGKPKDDPEVMMLVETIKDGRLDAVLCQSNGAVPYKIGQAIVLSANGQKGKGFLHLFAKKH